MFQMRMIGPFLRLEGTNHFVHMPSQTDDHLIQNIVWLVKQLALSDLKSNMPIS
jgi:hypothetical protein